MTINMTLKTPRDAERIADLLAALVRDGVEFDATQVDDRLTIEITEVK